MGDWYVGEIRVFPYPNLGNNLPKGWHVCDGTLLPVNQYAALFSLIGSTYGGDGRTTFALPNLCGHVIVGVGLDVKNNITYRNGSFGGVETVALTIDQMPVHTHSVNASSAKGTELLPTNNFLAEPNTPKNPPAGLPAPAETYGSATNLVSLDPSNVTAAGGSVAHENRQPSIGLVYAIALLGLYPARP